MFAHNYLRLNVVSVVDSVLFRKEPYQESIFVVGCQLDAVSWPGGFAGEGHRAQVDLTRQGVAIRAPGPPNKKLA